MGDPQGQHPLGPRADRQPLIGAGAGGRHTRLDLDQPPAHRPALGRLSLAELAVGLAVMGRREPGPQEIGPEGENIRGPAKVEEGQPGLAEDPLHRRPQHHPLVERLKAQQLGPVRPGEAVEDQRPLPPHRGGDQHHRASLATVAQLAQPGHQFAQGLVPGDGLKLPTPPVAGPAQRAAHPVGMVERLKPGLAADRRLPLIQGVVRVALDLDRPASHHPDDDPLASAAESAGAGEPGVEPFQQVFPQADRALQTEFPLRDAAGEGDGSGCSDADGFEKITACDAHRSPPRS